MTSHWEDPDRVRHFADRDPDHRLMKLLESGQFGPDLSILDLGCAGGRNTVVLAERGYDFYAVDRSGAMVTETRKRVARIVGEAEAEKRIRVGVMDDLSAFPPDRFDLVLALGIHHNARNRAEWERTLSETARVLKPGGTLLVSNFHPDSRPAGQALQPLENEANIYTDFGPDPMYLITADELDHELARYGLVPAVPTETVTVQTEKGFRVTVNGQYRKRAP